jgi:hypothetical protein
MDMAPPPPPGLPMAIVKEVACDDGVGVADRRSSMVSNSSWKLPPIIIITN